MYLVKNNKSPFYQVVFILNGKRTTVSTKTGNFREANKFLNNFSNNVAKEGEKEPTIKASFAKLTEFQEEYISFIESTKSKSYVRSVKLSFRMLIDFTEDIQLNRLEIRTVDRFITNTFSRTQKGASLYYRTLKAAFSKAVLWNYISENPFKKIKSPKVIKPFPIFISENELLAILNNTSEDYLRDLFITGVYTGMRLGELVNMKWTWINLIENQITVQCSDSFATKNKKGRVIPFNSNLNNMFMNRRSKILSIKNDDFVFSRIHGVRLNENYVSKKFKKYVRAAGLDERIHFHTLRHSFASLLVQRGVSLYVIKELLGHEALSTTQIYSHLQQQNLRDAVNLL